MNGSCCRGDECIGLSLFFDFASSPATSLHCRSGLSYQRSLQSKTSVWWCISLALSLYFALLHISLHLYSSLRCAGLAADWYRTKVSRIYQCHTCQCANSLQSATEAWKTVLCPVMGALAPIAASDRTLHSAMVPWFWSYRFMAQSLIRRYACRSQRASRNSI